MKFKIKRFDLNGTCYGETIFKGESKKACLKYLKDIFTNNKHLGIEREGTTFTKYTDLNVFHYAIITNN